MLSYFAKNSNTILVLTKLRYVQNWIVPFGESSTPPLGKGCGRTPSPLNQFTRRWAEGYSVAVPSWKSVTASFRQGRSVRYHSLRSFLMLPHSLDFILAFSTKYSNEQVYLVQWVYFAKYICKFPKVLPL